MSSIIQYNVTFEIENINFLLQSKTEAFEYLCKYLQWSPTVSQSDLFLMAGYNLR